MTGKYRNQLEKGVLHLFRAYSVPDTLLWMLHALAHLILNGLINKALLLVPFCKGRHWGWRGHTTLPMCTSLASHKAGAEISRPTSEPRALSPRQPCLCGCLLFIRRLMMPVHLLIIGVTHLFEVIPAKCKFFLKIPTWIGVFLKCWTCKLLEVEVGGSRLHYKKGFISHLISPSS